MNTIKQTMLLLFTLVIAVYAGNWYFSNVKIRVHLDNDALSDTIDTTITQLTVKQYSAEGQLVNQLFSPLMEHIPKGDVHWFQTPHIVITKENEPPWDIQSLQARSIDGGKSITFMKHVRVHQNADKKTAESTLKTEEITYYPEIKKATTKLFVTFEQAGNVMQSTGMNAWLDTQRVELLHRAKGRYDPAKA
jgi:lipopolysaccharide export system protein LptC